jgi:hypothetical protein
MSGPLSRAPPQLAPRLCSVQHRMAFTGPTLHRSRPHPRPHVAALCKRELVSFSAIRHVGRRNRAAIRDVGRRNRAAIRDVGRRNRAAVAWGGTTARRPPPPRTKWTRRVPHPVLIGHAPLQVLIGAGTWCSCQKWQRTDCLSPLLPEPGVFAAAQLQYHPCTRCHAQFRRRRTLLAHLAHRCATCDPPRSSQPLEPLDAAQNRSASVQAATFAAASRPCEPPTLHCVGTSLTPPSRSSPSDT